MNRILESYKSDLELRGHAKTTIESELSVAELFTKFLNGIPQDIEKDDLKRYLSHLRSRNLRQGSIGHYFSAVNTFLDFLLEEGVINNNPAPHIRKRYLNSYKAEKRERRIISVKDAVHLVNSIVSPTTKL